MRGDLSYSAPSIEEATHALDHLRDHQLPGELPDPDRVDYFKKMLLEPVRDRADIYGHLDNVAQHRSYVRVTYDLWELSTC